METETIETPVEDGAKFGENINIDADPEPEKKTPEESAEEPGAEEKDPIKKAKEKTPPWFQKKIDEMTWKINEERRQRESLQKQLEEREVKTTEIPEFNKPKPDRETFDFDDDAYLDALTDWKIEKLEFERQAKAKAEAEISERNKRAQTFESKRVKTMEKGISKYDDFGAVINSLPPDVMNQEVASALVETSNSEDVAYFLGKNIEEAQRISQLDPIQIAIELGTISNKLAMKPVKTATTAPPPINPLSGAGGSTEKDPSQMTDKEYSKWRRERIKKRR